MYKQKYYLVKNYYSMRDKSCSKNMVKFLGNSMLAGLPTTLCLIFNASTALAQLQSPPLIQTIPSTPANPVPLPPVPGATAYGNQISLNGRILPGAWFTRTPSRNQSSLHIADGALRQLIGLELLDTNTPTKQPVNWFSSHTKPQVLDARLTGIYRYLDVTQLVKTAGWQITAKGNILTINTPQTIVTDIREDLARTKPQLQQNASVNSSLEKLVFINLDRPTPWSIRQEPPTRRVVDPDAVNSQPTTPPDREWTIILDGVANPTLVQRYTPIAPIPAPIPLIPNLIKQLPLPSAPLPIPPIQPQPQPTVKLVEVVNNQTLIRISVPFGFAPRVRSNSNNSLTVEILSNAMLPRNIAWSPSIRWRSSWVNLGQESFPVVWLEVNPRNVEIRPILTNPNTLIGTAPLIQTAQNNFAVAGINGGYFNRNNQYPLGAIRRNGQWLSSPILNRGAIAWNNSGQFYVGRLTLEETLITNTNQRLPVLFVNSGYAQAGIARYTPAWGSTYTPLTNNEIIIVIQKNQIINQYSAPKAGETPILIPTDGYLIILRGNASANLNFLPIGATVQITSSTITPEFNRYPNIMGAGPLLLQNSQIVLDAKAEKFSDAFITEKAVRSGICTTANGTVLITSTHNRAGGAGPTLAEHAQLLQQMGCVNALNLDGGSSTSLYLGGQVIDRPPNTAARVHNGIGIFVK
ncbi:MAG: phosphodiester glycosidase family protein [Calothrix sp. C42_A2020_038]|nr:phosphodiester glycosidase family protein [Calothrix sp. C42_A2020_038]